MKAIEKAWNINLQLPKSEQWDSKETIISETCPHNEDFNIRLKNHTYKDGSVRCDDFGNEDSINKCTKCWQCEIEEEPINNKSTFKELRTCPANTDIVINENREDTFAKAIKDNDIIVYIENDTDIYYNDIPEIIKWLQDVYDYATELKNKVEYTLWCNARTHMEQGNKCKFKDVEYFIKNGELYWNISSNPTVAVMSLDMLDSKEWILL